MSQENRHRSAASLWRHQSVYTRTRAQRAAYIYQTTPYSRSVNLRHIKTKFRILSPSSTVHTLPLSAVLSSLPFSLESRRMSHWQQIVHSTGRLVKLDHPLLRLINIYNLPSISKSSHFNILRSKSLNRWKFWKHQTQRRSSKFQKMGILDYTSMKTSNIGWLHLLFCLVFCTII